MNRQGNGSFSHIASNIQWEGGLSLFCPVTARIKGYPFEVVIPQDLSSEGAILADQVKSLDWQTMQATYICKLPEESLAEVISKIGILLH
jgi:Growth inhibitor